MSRLFERFSSKENLKKAYRYIQNELARSSLSVNPFNHPAITAINDLGENFFVALEQYIRDGNYKPERGFFIYMPKDNLGIRPVCVLSMIDRIVYQAMLNPEILGYKIDGQLSERVCFAHRINDDEKSGDFLSPYFKEWDNFCKEQEKAFKKGYSWKLGFDVQQYYEHIPTGKLIEKLKNDFGVNDEEILNILEKQLLTWAEYPELPKGIPQGPAPSAVLANGYLHSLDIFAEKELTGKKLKYFRYADDITLMGKSKEDVLKATEKIVHFLRKHNLTLNEKTKIIELRDAEPIEAMRFFSGYEDDTAEIPEDEFTEVQNNVPAIVEALENGEKVEKSDIGELKYFLKIDTTYNEVFMERLINLIPIKPSLVVPIIQYISEGRKVLDDFDASIIDYWLWKIYNDPCISEWSRFWILKLLVSTKDGSMEKEISKEVQRILSSKENTIFKIVCFYHKAIHAEDIDIDEVKAAMDESKTAVEKSLYSFFLLNAFKVARAPVVKSCVEKLLNCASHEINLIGSYIFKNKPKTSVEDIDGVFSTYVLNKKRKKVFGKERKEQSEIYMVRSENLIPVSSPSAILGINRSVKKKSKIELNFPEIVQWEKVVLKIKEGMEEVEIWYDERHIQTANYVDLGFSSNKKEHKPDRKWNLLNIFSVMQNTDITQATPTNLMPMLARYSGHAIKMTNVHQTKKLLSNHLRNIFKTGDNPFTGNKKYYEPKFKILPEPSLRNKELWKQGGELKEHLAYSETDE